MGLTNSAKLIVYLRPEIKDEFSAICEGQDTNMTRVIRRLVNEYVGNHRANHLKEIMESRRGKDSPLVL